MNTKEALVTILRRIEAHPKSHDLSPLRDDLTDTPDRIMRSWDELYSGYRYDDEAIKKMMTIFDGIQYSGIVLNKDIEFYSMCEHHMLPFFGKAHVAYIPGKDQLFDEKVPKQKIPIPGKFKYRVVGLSKLARLVDVYARRLQTQERITEQVTSALDEHLQPLGSACVIESVHLCVCARGVSKQHSKMVTSSMTGTFLDADGTSRNELFSLIGRM